MWRMPYPMHGGFYGGRGLAVCAGTLLVGLLVLLVVWLIVSAQRRNRHATTTAGPSGATALPTTAPAGTARAVEIVRERYARGEINRDEFLRMKADLEGTPPPAEPPVPPQQ